MDEIVSKDTKNAAQFCSGCWSYLQGPCIGIPQEPRLYFCSEACVTTWRKRTDRNKLKANMLEAPKNLLKKIKAAIGL